MSLLTVQVYTIFEVIHCLRVCRLSEMNPGNLGVSLLSQWKGAKIGTLFWGGGVPKMDLEGRSKNGVQKCEEDEIKGSKSEAESSEIDLVLVFNMFPRPFPVKNFVKFTGKAENALRSKSKRAAVC